MSLTYANGASLTLAAPITSPTQTSIQRTSNANGLPGDSNGPPSGTYAILLSYGTLSEIAYVTGGQGSYSLTIQRAAEPMGGTQTALTYVPTGTTCPALVTSTALMDLGAPVYNVKSFGAYGDGVHDDTAAIQAAINAAGVSGGTAYLPTGTYLVTADTTPGQSTGVGAALYGLSDVSIVGDGRGATTLKVQTGTATGRSDGIAYGFDSAGTSVDVNDVAVSHLSISLEAVTATFGSGIRAVNTASTGSDASFTDLSVIDSKEWGVSWGGFTTNFQRLRVQHVVVNGAIFGGTWIGLTDYPEVLDLYAENVSGHSSSGEGCVLEVESGNYGSFTDIRGDNLPIQMVLISGNLEARFSGISGSLASGAHGVQIAGANNIEINDVNLTSPGGGSYGVNISSGAPSQIKLYGLDLSGFTNFVNTQGATSVSDLNISQFTFNGAGSGIVVGATDSPVTELNVSDGYCNGTGTWLAADNVAGLIRGVFISGSTSVSASPSLVIRDCPGYNPVGSSVPGTAFALPASGTAWTNNTGVDGTFYVTAAGTVSDVVVQGVTVASSLAVGQSFFIPAGGTITFTYSAAPTLVFVGN